MEKVSFKIKGIPAILWGSSSEKIYLYLHGQGGNKEEAEMLSQIAVSKNWQVLSIDLPEHGERKEEMDSFHPWIVVPQLHEVMTYIKSRWNTIALCANSIGAWFSMLSFNGEIFERCLFISPILDMNLLIKNMMAWASVTDAQLEEKQTIDTGFGQTLSWNYLKYTETSRIDKWDSKTYILYAEHDNLTEYQVAVDFVRQFHCELTVMKDGEHWFHTDKQLDFLRIWLNENCCIQKQGNQV